MKKLKTVWLVLVIGPLVGLLVASCLALYWYLEKPRRLVGSDYTTLVLTAGESKVVDVPVYYYEYLSPFYFSTKTTDGKGHIIWRTKSIMYVPGEQYKIVTPSKLSPGNFSIIMTINYQLNPLYRDEQDISFVNLLINPEPKR